MVKRDEMAMEYRPNAESDRERNDPNGGVSKWPGDVHKETDEAYRCGEDSEMLT